MLDRTLQKPQNTRASQLPSTQLDSLAPDLLPMGNATCSLAVWTALLVQRKEFLSVDRYVARRLDTQPNLAAVDVHDGDADVVADEDLFAQLPTED